MGGKSGGEEAYVPDNTPEFDFASMMGSMGEMGSVPSGPSAEEIQADADERAEADRVTTGLNDRDSAYSSYLDAGSTATDYVNNMITGEQSNADLLGIDYSITDEDKQGRIDNYFASIWGEGDQTTMQNLFDEFGNPDDFTEFQFTRGEATDTAASSTEAVSTSSEGQPAGATFSTDSLLAEEDEKSILGGG